MQGQEALQEDLFKNVPSADVTETISPSLVTTSEPERVGPVYEPTSTEVWLAGFVLCNLILAEVLFYTPLYGRFERELREILLYFSIIMAITMCAVSAGRLVCFAAYQLRAGRWVAELNASLSILVLGSFFVWAAIFDRALLLTQPLTHSLLVAASIFFLFQKGLALFSDYLEDCGIEIIPCTKQAYQKGDQITLGNGDIVPCDGLILAGDAECRERRFSPLPVLRIKRKGDVVYACSRIVSGKLTVEVQGLASESPISWFIQKFKSGLSKIEQLEKGRARLIFAWNLGSFALSLLGAQMLLSAGASFAEAVRFSSSVLFLALFSHLFIWDVAVLRALSAKLFGAGFLLKDYTAVKAAGRCKSVVIDHISERPVVKESVVRFQPLDDFVDREGLLRIIAVVLSSSDDPLYLNIAQMCRDQIQEALAALKVEKYHEYDGLGVSAEVSGAQVSIGTEEFMLARGVELQSSDLESADSLSTLLVALGVNVVARFDLGQSSDEREAVTRLRNAGVRLLLFSREAGVVADDAGKKLGLELSNIHGGLTENDYTARLSQMDDCAFISNGRIDAERARAVTFSIAPFDELLWDTEKSDLTIFDPKLSKIARFFVVAQRLPGLLRAGWGLVLGLPIAFIPLLYLGFFGPVHVLATAAGLMTVLAVFAHRTVGRLLPQAPH